MMNAPTNSAMSANTSRNDVEEAEVLLDRVGLLLGVRLLPVIDLVLLADRRRRFSVGAMLSRTSVWETPGLASTSMQSHWSTRFATRCAVSGRERAPSVAPASLSAAAELEGADELVTPRACRAGRRS